MEAHAVILAPVVSRVNFFEEFVFSFVEEVHVFYCWLLQHLRIIEGLTSSWHQRRRLELQAEGKVPMLLDPFRIVDNFDCLLSALNASSPLCFDDYDSLAAVQDATGLYIGHSIL